MAKRKAEKSNDHSRKRTENHTVANLDAGQLDFMWNMLRIGGCKPSVSDVKCMIENVDAVRQMLIQKTGGNRADDPQDYISNEDMGTHINLVVVSALALRTSGMLDALLEVVEQEERRRSEVCDNKQT